MRLCPIRLCQVPLQIPALVNGTALMHELFTEPGSKHLDQPTAAIGDKQNSAGEDQPATLQVHKQRLTDLVIF